MEHYILSIWKDCVSEENQAFVEDYLAKLTPTSLHHQYSLQFSSQIALLLKPVASYSAVLTKSLNENVEWKGPAENFEVKDIIPEEINIVDSVFEVSPKDFSEQISACIHSLADQLPAFGTYKLDIVLGSDVLKNLSVSEEPALAAAFYRLTRWHSAHFAIFVQTELDREKLDEWCKIINVEILEKKCISDLGSTIWRGDFQLETANASENISYKSFEIKLDLIQNEDNFCVFKSLHEDIIHETTEHIVLSPNVHIIDQCSFASIPSYMISPVIFRLILNRPNFLNEESSDLSHLIKENNEALIVRLGYTKINERTKSERKYCTNRWVKAVSSGSIKDAECFLSNFENYISFAVTKSNSSDHILALPLQEPSSLNASFYFNFVNCKMSRSSNPVQNEAEENNALYNNVSKIPVINSSLFYMVIEKLRKHKTKLYKDGCIGSDPKLSEIWENVRKVSNNLLSEKTITSSLQFEEIDPSDWPERIYLLFKQMQREEENKSFTPNALLGLGPKLPQQSVSFSSKDVKKFFLPSGESKSAINIERIHPLSNINNLTVHDLNAVLHLKWPEVADCIYHDLYYNSSCQMEEKETVGNRMVNTYVKHETASTCNKQQIMQNFTVIIPGKSSPSTKEFRSPSYRKVASTVRQNMNRSKDSDCKENMVRDLIGKKILSTSRMACSQTITKKEQISQKDLAYKNSNRVSVKRKLEGPVRCSPRKKNPVNYTYPSVNRNIQRNQNDKVSKSTGLPDLLRRKLRNAVATALENNGINLDDAFFQPCGKRLFTICQAFVQDIPQKKGKTSEHLQKIADAHVKQVIEFERMKKNQK